MKDGILYTRATLDSIIEKYNVNNKVKNKKN